MSAARAELAELAGREHTYGFSTDLDTDFAPRGLSEDLIAFPEWLGAARQRAAAWVDANGFPRTKHKDRRYTKIDAALDAVVIDLPPGTVGEGPIEVVLVSLPAGPPSWWHPLLEINADDVACTHGAAVGQLDPDALPAGPRTRGSGQARRPRCVGNARWCSSRAPARRFPPQVSRSWSSSASVAASPSRSATGCWCASRVPMPTR